MQNCDFWIRITSLYRSQTSPLILCMRNIVISTRITSLHWSQTSPVVCCMQNIVISIRITSLYGSQPSPVLFACKTAALGPELQVCIGHRPHLCFFLHSKQRLRTRIASLSVSQPSSVVLRIQNSAFSIRNSRLYRSQHSFVAFACKTATLGPEIQVSMGPRPHLCFFACKTATLAPELQVSIGPSPHLWFVHAKQRLLDQNYKSLWVPAIICSFVHSNLWL